MSRVLKFAGVGAVIVATVVALGAISAAFAQTTTPEAGTLTRVHMGGGFGRGLGGEAGLEAAAEALGMTADELSTQLWGGRTLAEIAEEAGVDLQDVRDAVTAAMVQETRDAIEAAVEAGTISQTQADWLLEGLDAGYWGPNAEGFGGFHDFGPRGFAGPGLRGSGFRFSSPTTSTATDDA